MPNNDMPENHETDQDEVSYRRLTTYELRRLTREFEELRAHPSLLLRVALPLLAGALLTGAIGYIGIIHQLVLTDRLEIQRISGEQFKRTSLLRDVEEIKNRLLINENLAQQIPFMVQQLRDMNNKLDRLIERPRRDNMPY